MGDHADDYTLGDVLNAHIHHLDERQRQAALSEARRIKASKAGKASAAKRAKGVPHYYNSLPVAPGDKGWRRYWWKMKDGNFMQIADMKDDHLLNTILFIEKIRDEDSSEQSWWATSLYQSYDAMEAERVKRELPFPLIPLKSIEYRQGEF